MKPAYQTIIAASDDERRDLFLATARRLGTTIQNIEKDFWVCWTLDALFHHLPRPAPRLLFKGGTSLSKGYNLISRFSEDIDITVFRDDIGAAASAPELNSLSNRGRERRLDAIKGACQDYINGQLLRDLSAFARRSMNDAGQDPERLRIVPDLEDTSRQSLLIHYPGVADGGGYVKPIVKIESGAKSALDPHKSRTIIPYLAEDMPSEAELATPDVTTIEPERTFLDKILILHGQPICFAAHGRFYGSGQISRHYYDVHCMVREGVGERAARNHALVDDCIEHSKVFFFRKDTGLEAIARGAFQLEPPEAMLGALRRDYEAMAVMVFGAPPPLEEILQSVAQADAWLNAV